MSKLLEALLKRAEPRRDETAPVFAFGYVMPMCAAQQLAQLINKEKTKQ